MDAEVRGVDPWVNLRRKKCGCFDTTGFSSCGIPCRTNSYAKYATLATSTWREVEPVVKDPDGRPIRLSKALERDPIFERAIRHPVVIEPLSSLLGPNFVAIRNRHNHLPLNPSRVRPDAFHRDNRQWTRSLVTIICYLEPTTVENGCTRVVPGSHLWPGIEPSRLEEDARIAGSGLLEQDVPVPMPAGGLLVIDSLVFHRIGTNRTEDSRMSMTFGFHAVDEFAAPDDPKRLLISGSYTYGGNDRA